MYSNKSNDYVYIISSKKGYWNDCKRDWVSNIYSATFYHSKPFADGRRELLREKYGMKVLLKEVFDY